ncbi:MAG: arylsulfatase [Flavobacteriaceae bacterium]
MSFRILFCLILFIGLSNCKETPNPKSLPNVILILVDDMGYSDLGSYGSEVATPNIDRLAYEGVRFTNAYNTSKCFPSRAAILTGLYSQQTGYHENFRQPMRNAITLGELFRSAGYTTLWSGKHHSIENPVDRGFDHYSGLLDGAANHFNPGLKREGEGQPAQKGLKKTPVTYRNWVIEGEVFNPYTPKSKDFYTTDVFTNYALDWMGQIKPEKPFFLYLSYTAPHDPLMAWPEDIEKYKNRYTEGYEVIRNQRFEKQKQLGILPKNTLLSQAEHTDWNSLTDEEKAEESKTMTVYAAMIDRLDQNIGRILEKLEKQRKLNNTLILFTSDNGGSSEVVEIPGGTGEIGTATNWKSLGKNWANVSNTPFREYKNWSHEGGIKTPLIAYWPEKIKNKGFVSHKPVHFIDFLPTLQEVSGADYPQNLNGNIIFPSPGKSFLPQILGDASNERNDPIFWQWRHGKAVRDGNWKLVAHKDVWELYNLESDPVEEMNLIEKEKEKAAQLKARYEDWAGQFEITKR